MSYVLRPPPPERIYAYPPPMVVRSKDSLLREVERILPWRRHVRRKIPTYRQRVFYLHPRSPIGLPSTGVVILLPPSGVGPTVRIFFMPLRREVYKLLVWRSPHLLPPAKENFVIINWRGSKSSRRIRPKRVMRLPSPPLLKLLPPSKPRRSLLPYGPPPEYENYKEKDITLPTWAVGIVFVVTLPSWILLWALGAFTLRDIPQFFKR